MGLGTYRNLKEDPESNPFKQIEDGHITIWLFEGRKLKAVRSHKNR